MKFSNYQNSIRFVLLTKRKYKMHKKMQEGATSRSHCNIRRQRFNSITTQNCIAIEME